MRDRLEDAAWTVVSLPLYAAAFVAIRALDWWFRKPLR